MVIPSELSEVAEELSLSYAEALELLVVGVPLVSAFWRDYSIPKIMRLRSTDYESVENCCFTGLFGNSECELCARFQEAVLALRIRYLLGV